MHVIHHRTVAEPEDEDSEGPAYGRGIVPAARAEPNVDQDEQVQMQEDGAAGAPYPAGTVAPPPEIRPADALIGPAPSGVSAPPLVGSKRRHCGVSLPDRRFRVEKLGV